MDEALKELKSIGEKYATGGIDTVPNATPHMCAFILTQSFGEITSIDDDQKLEASTMIRIDLSAVSRAMFQLDSKFKIVG